MTTTTAARHSSESNEHYTPVDIVEAARRLMGGIDLDPASSIAAQERVKAEFWYGLDYPHPLGRDGLYDAWSGSVFLNPPGGIIEVNGKRTSSQKAWWQKLVAEYAADRVTSAIFVCFSVELLQTTQVNQVGALPLDFPICFPSRRISYCKPDGSVGKSPPHSSCIIYLPPKSKSPEEALADFRAAFGWLGAIK